MKYSINHLLSRSLSLPVGLLSVFCFLPSVTAVAKEKVQDTSGVEIPKTTIKADSPSLKMAFNLSAFLNEYKIKAAASC